MDLQEHDLKGRRLAHYMWGELEKIAAGAGTDQQEAGQGAPAGELEGNVQQGAEGAEEASPAHGIVAARIEQLDDKKARGTPVIQPPPGFVYEPELQSFVPNEEDPGWMQIAEAQEAAKNQAIYAKGQEDMQVSQAQQQMDTQVEQETQQAVAEQEAGQQQAAIQQQATAEATTKEVAQQQAKSVASNLSTPDSITGSPAPQRKPASGKGVTIKIGK